MLELRIFRAVSWTHSQLSLGVLEKSIVSQILVIMTDCVLQAGVDTLVNVEWIMKGITALKVHTTFNIQIMH